MNILIYSGKGTAQHDTLGHGYAVVEKLMEPYVGKGHTVFLDHFYTSVGHANKILEKKTHIVGTLRKNKKTILKKL